MLAERRLYVGRGGAFFTLIAVYLFLWLPSIYGNGVGFPFAGRLEFLFTSEVTCDVESGCWHCERIY